jgi:Mor family transcriptional regulator
LISPADRAGLDRYPEELDAAAQQVGARLAELGVGRDDAATIGWEVAEHLRRYWGGRKPYIFARRESDPRQGDLLGGDIPGSGLAAQEILADVAEQVEERLLATGAEREVASSMGWEVAAHLHAYWGGGEMYVCKGLHYEIGLRDREIYRRCNALNYDWLATEYGLTVQHIYRIVKRVTAAERAQRQLKLLEDDL